MCKEHFDLLPEPHRDRILLGLGNIAGDLTGVFMFFAGNLARICFGAAFHFGRTGLTGVFQSLILGDAFACGFTVRIRIIAPELLERFTFGADVLVVLSVPFKVGARPCAVSPACFVQHRNVGFDVTANKPPEHWA